MTTCCRLPVLQRVGTHPQLRRDLRCTRPSMPRPARVLDHRLSDLRSSGYRPRPLVRTRRYLCLSPSPSTLGPSLEARAPSRRGSERSYRALIALFICSRAPWRRGASHPPLRRSLQWKAASASCVSQAVSRNHDDHVPPSSDSSRGPGVRATGIIRSSGKGSSFELVQQALHFSNLLGLRQIHVVREGTELLVLDMRVGTMRRR
jgi:hypothetical protein